jgi:tryptophan synthase beta subunit
MAVRLYIACPLTLTISSEKKTMSALQESKRHEGQAHSLEKRHAFAVLLTLKKSEGPAET